MAVVGVYWLPSRLIITVFVEKSRRLAPNGTAPALNPVLSLAYSAVS